MTNRDRKELKKAERATLANFENIRTKLRETPHRIAGKKVHYTFSERYEVRENLNLTFAASHVGRWSKIKASQL